MLVNVNQTDPGGIAQAQAARERAMAAELEYRGGAAAHAGHGHAIGAPVGHGQPELGPRKGMGMDRAEADAIDPGAGYGWTGPLAGA